MNMKDMIQRMTDIESNKGKKQLKESTVAECGMPMSSAPMEQQGNPVTMSISLNASGKEHVADLINMMKNAGLQAAGPVAADTMPMRMDMERLRGIVDEPEMEEADAGGFDRATTEPDEAYGDLDSAIPNGDDLHKKKKMYAKAQDGDNAMAVETIKARLLAALTEKKAKPDFLDMDKDGNKKEPFKKAVADKKKSTVKEASEAFAKGARVMYMNTFATVVGQDGDSYVVKVDKQPNTMKVPASAIKKPSYDESVAEGDKTMSRAAKGHEKYGKEGMQALAKAGKEGKSLDPIRKKYDKYDEAAKPDFLDMDKDGDKKEPMKKAVADKKKNPFAKKDNRLKK
jgi:hypothetical protein